LEVLATTPLETTGAVVRRDVAVDDRRALGTVGHIQYERLRWRID